MTISSYARPIQCHFFAYFKFQWDFVDIHRRFPRSQYDSGKNLPSLHQEVANLCMWQPKAAAMQWANRALSLESRKDDPSAASICICIREREDDDTWFDFEASLMCPVMPSSSYLSKSYIYIYTVPGTRLSSIFSLGHSTTRSFPIKRRVICVPAVYV